MAKLPRRCLDANKPGCAIVSFTSYCAPCTKRKGQEKRAKVGDRYGQAHKMARSQMLAFVASGQAVCARCHRGIGPLAKWDLDHVEQPDGSWFYGPSHATCNRAAGGRHASH